MIANKNKIIQENGGSLISRNGSGACERGNSTLNSNERCPKVIDIFRIHLKSMGVIFHKCF